MSVGLFGAMGAPGLFFGWFDPFYLLFLLPGMLLALIAQAKVKSAYRRASKIRAQSGLSGFEAARHILDSSGLYHVSVEPTRGHLSDHYDPRSKVLRLSEQVYGGSSLASLGIAAHEAGHALQDAKNYAPLVVRNAFVPMASFGSGISMFVILAGAVMQWMNLILIGIGLFSLGLVFQLINLPCEFNASTRARQELLSLGLVTQDEDRQVKKVLSAAAMTYVAATITTLLTLLYYLWRFGVFSSRDD